MKQIEIRHLRKLDAEFSVPGDKSISHRGILLGGIATGTTRLRGFLPGEDCLSTLHAMQALGCRIDRVAPDEVLIEGRGGKLLAPAEPIIAETVEPRSDFSQELSQATPSRPASLVMTPSPAAPWPELPIPCANSGPNLFARAQETVLP